MNQNGMMDDDDNIFGAKSERDNHTVADNRTSASQQAESTSITVAIDDFMRSPRTGANIKPYAMPGLSQSQKKTGVCVSKSYQMLCGRCGRRFTKVMVLDLSSPPQQSSTNPSQQQQQFIDNSSRDRT